MSGKGSKQRPAQVSGEELARRWELAFGKKREDTSMSAYKDQAVKVIKHIFCDDKRRAYTYYVDYAVRRGDHVSAAKALTHNHKDDPLAELLADLIL